MNNFIKINPEFNQKLFKLLKTLPSIDDYKNDYLEKFMHQLNQKKESNNLEKNISKMSRKYPIPIANYNYSIFNFIPKIYKEIFISDIFNKNKKIYKRHFYKYLLGKIISDLYWDDFIYFLISDEKEDIMAVSIFHLDNKFYPINIEELQEDYFKKGKYILIINPLFTHEHYDEIMCFEPCEFILFENKEILSKFINLNNNINNEEDLMNLGDLMSERCYFDKAIFYYDKGIKFLEKNLVSYGDNNEKKILLIKLIYKICTSYFNYGYFSKSLFYSDYFFKLINSDKSYFSKNSNIKDIKLKIFVFKLRSFIGLRKYEEGYQFYIENKDDIEIQELLQSKENNLTELIKKLSINRKNEIGIFNYKKMLLEEKKDFYLNYGDYINEKISIDFDSEKGLKLVCKNNKFIKKGELIIAEKALVSKNRKIISNDTNYIKNNSGRKEDPSDNLEMTHELMEKIKKYKEDYKIFFILYNGKNKLKDLKERQKSYLNNIEKKIDFIEVKNIIDSNKYSASRNIFFENNLGVGLWGYISIMNHSCNPNINNFTIGDFMFCFAVKDIFPGEELNTLYFSNSDHYSLRQEKSKNWNFSCSCKFCLKDKNKINNLKKIYYENSIKLFYENKNDKFKHEKYFDKYVEFEKFLEENRNILEKYELGNGYLKLIYHYGVLNNFKKSKELSEKMFSELEKENYYSLFLENLNCLFYFFGYKDKNINIKYLLKIYEKLILNYTNFNKEDFEALVRSTLDLE